MSRPNIVRRSRDRARPIALLLVVSATFCATQAQAGWAPRATVSLPEVQAGAPLTPLLWSPRAPVAATPQDVRAGADGWTPRASIPGAVAQIVMVDAVDVWAPRSAVTGTGAQHAVDDTDWRPRSTVTADHSAPLIDLRNKPRGRGI